MHEMSQPPVYDDTLRFGPSGRFELRPRQRQVLADGQPLKLGARAFDLLLALIQQCDRTLSKHELLDRVWPDTVVAENNLEVHVWSLRKLLGAQTIVTVPGRGYRFAEVVQAGLPSAPLPVPTFLPSPVPAAAHAPRSHLPERLATLLGRAEELAALAALVDGHALVSVVGAAGVGKTLLALHLLESRRAAYGQGVCWVDLSALQDGALVAPSIAAALGLSLGSGDALAALAAALAPLSLLLALDNAEHLLPEVARLAGALLARAGTVCLLVTSQAPLKLAAESVFRLGPLAVPRQPVDAAEAGQWGALALFEARVRAGDHHFRLNPSNVETARLLCQRLDGCALAIELAAARVPLLGLERLASSLGERLHLLTKSRRDAPPRHQSLRAALEWTHALLGDNERIVFRRMAVLAGGAGLDLLQAVMCDATLDRWCMLDALDALIDRSLVVASTDEPPRYRLLESPLALAQEQLAASGEGAAAERRHALWVQAHFKALNDRCNEGAIGYDALILALEPDLDNARAALAWALGKDPDVAVALARPMARALTLVRYAECDALWHATQARFDEGMAPDLRAQWLLGNAVFRVDRDARRGEADALGAAALFRELKNEHDLVRALAVIASSRLEGADERQQAALAEMRLLVQPNWPPSVQAEVCKAESLFAYRRGDWETVETWLPRWLQHAEAIGSEISRNAVQMNLADMALARGRSADAARLGLELETRLRGTRQLHALAILRMNLAAALLACDDASAARRVAVDAWPTAIGFELQSYWVDSLALLAALEGRFVTAARLWGRSEATYRAKGEKREANQARAAERAQAMARAALGSTAFELEAGDGRSIVDTQIGTIALQSSDGEVG